MKNKFKIPPIIKSITDVFSAHEPKFRFIVGLKIASISVLTMFLLTSFTFVFLKIDLLFFEAHGYPMIPELTEAFYDSIFSTMHKFLGYFTAMLILNYFIGVYIGHLMQRPFKEISKYCEAWVKGDDIQYSSTFFSDLTLLTSFSEFFFNICESAKKNGKFSINVTPAKYKNIHSPVFERSFFLHYGLFILITVTLSGLFLTAMADQMYIGIIDLALKTLKESEGMKIFFSGQLEVFQYIINIVLIIHVALSLVVIFSFYSKVAGPAFAIFSTMRSFSKGKFGNRVHLIGSYFLRNDCRSINRYLDFVENNYTK